MKKTLLSLMLLPALSFASSLDMSTLKCNDMQISNTTTLKSVQTNCLIKKETTHDGMYEVEFVNTTTGKSVKCDFANKRPNSVVNGCRS